MFIPDPPTSDLYSEVVEPISIEQGDLIRLSDFNKPKDAYYEVINSEIVPAPPKGPFSLPGEFKAVSVGGLGFSFSRIFEYRFFYNSTANPTANFEAGDTFTVSGTSSTNNRSFTVMEVKSINVASVGTSITQTILVLAKGPLFELIADGYGPNEIVSSATFTFANTLNKLQVTLNSPINLIKYKGDESFAIFKSKPDETSVIVEHKKKDGEVAQTLLIPEDISKEVKDKIGDIVKNINVDLS
jgi:hypothetical protein